VELPALIDTVAGTTAAGLLLDNETTAPPVGAAPVSVTVPVAAIPPVTVGGLSDTAEIMIGGVIVSVEMMVTPL
jgi:hypothetical protein